MGAAPHPAKTAQQSHSHNRTTHPLTEPAWSERFPGLWVQSPAVSAAASSPQRAGGAAKPDSQPATCRLLLHLEPANMRHPRPCLQVRSATSALSVRINSFSITVRLPNHKGNFNRKSLLCVGRDVPTSFTASFPRLDFSSLATTQTPHCEERIR